MASLLAVGDGASCSKIKPKPVRAALEPGVSLVDGKRIDPLRPYDPDGPDKR